MKTITLIFIAIACLLILTEQKSRKHKNNKHKQPADSYQAPGEIRASIDTQPRHIQDMVIGNPNTLSKDRHPLWRGFPTHYERPFNHGVVGPQWEVPLSQENDRGFKHIASPMPKPEMIRRIYPSEFAPTTYSPTSFDMPMRKDVVQVDIPEARITTTEENIDPRFPPKKPVAKVTGTLYHGTGSTDARVSHGLPAFIEKKAKNRARSRKTKTRKSKARKHKKTRNSLKSRKHHKRHNSDGSCTPEPIVSQTHNAKSEALNNARMAEEKATRMLESITNNLTGEGKMVLDVELLNRYEQPDIRIHENNLQYQKRMNEIRYTPAGVRAAHTIRRLSK